MLYCTVLYCVFGMFDSCVHSGGVDSSCVAHNIMYVYCPICVSSLFSIPEETQQVKHHVKQLSPFIEEYRVSSLLSNLYIIWKPSE